MSDPNVREVGETLEGEAAPGVADEPDPARAALRRCTWLAGGLLVLAVAAIASLPSYYNALFGPFVLSADKLRDAQELSDLGWERHFEADFESLEDTGWYQFLWTQETFTGVAVSTSPEKHYLLASLGSVLIAVESNSRETGRRRVVGTLLELPPKLRSMLEQGAEGAPIPRFFLQERSASYGWLVELAFGGLLGVWLLRSFGKALLALKEARRGHVIRPSRTAERWGPN